MAVTRLDDPGDVLLADYRTIPDPELVARRGLFVAEGRLVVRRLLTSSRLAARSVMVTETAYSSLLDAIESRREMPVYVVPQHVMNAIAGFNIHRGCLALGERPPAGDWRELARHARRLAVLERIGDADNVGSIFRNSAAFGIDGVLIGPSCADPLYRKAIRTSMGAALSMPFARVDDWPEALTTLSRMGYALVAMTPDAAAPPLREVAVLAAERAVAVVLGHEGEGLAPAALAACRYRARIPMAAGADSLNVATAAAIAFYELTRGA